MRLVSCGVLFQDGAIERDMGLVDHVSMGTHDCDFGGDGEHVILQDISHTDSDDNLHRPLLLRPQPPEEAFRAFSMFRHWNEDETLDDSFTIGSPMPHPIVLKPLDANSERDLETSEDMGGNVA
eukprot:CAMPEP_0178821746 /NCGR_PEP_ID=MMETSP0746-20121128/4227_1 /TAXON_ID=913974 /ORGANISM="Nitzschia punctata, Strain CCMP561" /LENGTH=123 /DNA_ID=CAMNT_0020483213 /DNA_START=297 /DNA_END=668 /DNA_ORIENTATION=-